MKPQALGRLAATALPLGYPLLVHAAIVTASPWLSFAALVLLGANILAPWLSRGCVWAWCALAAIVPASGGFVMIGESRLFLYAAPVLVALALLWFFGRTLRAGQVPLITRVATAMRGPLPAPVRAYTRAVTRFWVGFFALLALTDLLLALLAPPVLWSLFTNFLCYGLVAFLLIAEWLFRRWAMRAYESMTWRQYLGALARLDYRGLV